MHVFQCSWGLWFCFFFCELIYVDDEHLIVGLVADSANL